MPRTRRLGSFGRHLACRVSLAGVAVTLALVAPAPSTAMPLLGHDGRWLTDPLGRVVILHGVQIDHFAPDEPLNVLDIAPADVQAIAAAGFNLARVSMSYQDVEPSPGAIGNAYIDTYLALDRELAAAGVWDLVDLQQGQYSIPLAGNGFPGWMTETDGLPNTQTAFPLGYFDNPAEERAWDNFWADAPASDGIGLQDHYAAGLRTLATRFATAPGLVGFDVLNEPWPGSLYPTCANPVGCPPGGFDQTSLASFYVRVFRALRRADATHLIVYEPNVFFNSGAPTALPALGDRNLIFAFHNYCLGDEPGLPQMDPGDDCGIEEQLVLQNAATRVRQSGDAPLMDEWGNSADQTLLARMTAEADQSMIGWSYWAWEDCCRSPGAIVVDASKAPNAPGNLRSAVLATLARPYPQLTAGTPTGWSFDQASGRFTFSYSTHRVAGGTFPSGTVTQVELPAMHYPTGYDATVSGARVVSAPDADPLLLAAAPGASTVILAVRPASHHPAAAGTTSWPGATTAAPALDCPAEHARVLRIHAHGRRGRIVAVALYIDGRRTKFLRGHSVRRIGIPAGLQNGSVVRIVATTARGARVTTTRSVSGCRLTAPRTAVRRA